ncbi:50S ribosomal protein L6 [Actomonas aquatica]|uniref:Large ribosomal subunit protein uL6 n=1 Tax=Actomonas aquatica TaxID=2866162 RepID=A0ABZ1CDU5_9BACT|nr:50S ribosomal protein L6 [Opitutus sp. WL0086]WRQ89658.1 50S ribosomal protein L6 [Opitutus sp. WL0086]
MSRIGKQPVPVPEKVKVTISGQTMSVEGPKGKLEKTFNNAAKFVFEEGEIRVSPADKTRFANAMYGTARSIIAGMVQGVTEGFVKDLEISGVGFKAVLKGNTLDLALGYSHPILYPVPDGITVTVTDQTKVKVEGVDKQLVGEVAANIRSYYPAEPYKGKGVKYVGERVRRKEGKTVA